MRHSLSASDGNASTALRLVGAALMSVTLSAAAMAVGLNDTGFTTCADASGATVSCTSSTAVQGQDARYGRDAAAGTGALTKVGNGANGFDFTKISNGTSSTPGVPLPPTAALGTGPNDWACTYDNTTGLMWEVKTTSGLRSRDSVYYWYSSNSATNGGKVGNPSSSGNTNCSSTGRCDTEKFLQDVNGANLCGHNDWRLPTFRELYSLTRLYANLGSGPAFEASYFPNIVSGSYFPYLYWSGTSTSNGLLAWGVLFGNGLSATVNKEYAGGYSSPGAVFALLVRTGQ